MNLLTPTQVRTIRLLYDDGTTLRNLGRAYRRSPSTILKVVRGMTYKDVKPPRSTRRGKRGRPAGIDPDSWAVPRTEVQDMYWLRYTKGLTYRQLAEHFGVSHATVHSYIQAGIFPISTAPFDPSASP